MTRTERNGDRKARCTTRARRGPRASLWYWSRDVSLPRVMMHYVLTVIARVSPSFRFKNWLYRVMGARVAPTAAVGLEVTFDVFFPGMITVEEDAIIGYNTTVLCHEYTRDWYRTGPVIVKRDATIGANCTLLPGVIVGEGATVSAMSLVNRDVPPGETWGGVPARPLRGTSRDAGVTRGDGPGRGGNASRGEDARPGEAVTPRERTGRGEDARPGEAVTPRERTGRGEDAPPAEATTPGEDAPGNPDGSVK